MKNINDFSTLSFKFDDDGLPLERAERYYNGYKLSVVKESNSPGRYEVAVLDANNNLIRVEGIHSSDDDVIRCLTEEEVTAIMIRLQAPVIERSHYP